MKKKHYLQIIFKLLVLFSISSCIPTDDSAYNKGYDTGFNAGYEDGLIKAEEKNKQAYEEARELGYQDGWNESSDDVQELKDSKMEEEMAKEGLKIVEVDFVYDEEGTNTTNQEGEQTIKRIDREGGW